MTDKSFAAQVWQTLTAIDVTPHVEQKGSLDYISWAHCLQILRDTYPDTKFPTFGRTDNEATGTVSVRCRVTIAEGDKEVTQEMSLPVMDYKNKAITNPDERDINDSNMRCFVKCCATHGLGISMYQKELNVPEVKKEPIPPNWADDAQMMVIQDFADAGKIPEETTKWLDGRKWKMTKNQAAELIKKLKEQGNE